MRGILILAASLALAGCVSATSNLQSPTPTEQLLRSHASEDAAAKADLRLARGAKVFLVVDAGDDTPAGKYLAAAFAAHLTGRGAELVLERAGAGVVVHLRISAAGIEDRSKIYGLAAMTVPPLPGTPIHTAMTTPELAIYALRSRTGVAEIYATATDLNGRLLTAIGPVSAEVGLRGGSVLSGIGFGDLTAKPGIQALK